MKKYIAFLMIFALILACGCNKKPVDTPVQDEPPVQEQPQIPPADPVTPPEVSETPEIPETPVVPEASVAPETPQSPETPEVPVTPEAPETPETSEEPQQPVLMEPDGAVSKVQLPVAIEGSGWVDCILPLEGSIVALRSFGSDGKVEILVHDLENNAVLSRLEVDSHDGTNELILKDTDPYALRYYDGQDEWEITLDETWQQSREEFDLALYLSVMGGLMVHQKSDGSISVGRVVPPGLQANDRMGYHLVRILNDHQLLYQAVDKTVSNLSHYGVYDSETGETRAVTTMGQTVLGSWGDVLLIGRTDNGWRYDFGWVTLTDYTYTPLKIGHETAETGINGDYYGSTDYIQCDPESGRLLLVGDKDGTRTAEVVSLETGEILYTMERPTEESWQFYLAQGNRLLVRKGESDDSILWLVEHSVLPENAVPMTAEWEPPQQSPEVSWLQPTQWQMGEHTVTWEDHVILVDGTAVLDGDYRVQEAACAEGLSYSVRAILDDHRILYVCGGSLIIDHIGIYDHQTGEDQIFAGENSVVRQLEEDRLLFYYSDHGVMNADGYDFFLVHLENCDIQPLETGHDGWESKTDWVTFNAENTRLCLVTDGLVQVFDLQSSEEVFRWQGAQDADVEAWPDGEEAVVIRLGNALWLVEY